MSEKKEKDSEAKEKGLADVLKKVASIGMGAAFLTEDAIKNMVGDIPLPKDILSGLLQNAKSAKEDLANALREEFRKYLSKVDPEKLTENILENYDIEVEAKLKFKKKNQGQ
ncbi:MAG: hypothetical protein Fur0010_14290 [Bdellovibrio sp.]